MQTNSSFGHPLLPTMIMGIFIFYSLTLMIIYPLGKDFILFITANGVTSQHCTLHMGKRHGCGLQHKLSR